MKLLQVVLCASVLFAPALGVAQSVNNDWDKTVDFSKFKSYAWTEGTPVKDELNHNRMIAAIDAQLALKGLKVVAKDGNPDALIAYHASFKDDIDVQTWTTGYHGRYGWGGYGWGNMGTTTTQVSKILTGTVIVDMVDASSKNVVWRGVATKEIDVKASPDKREKNINKAAQKLFNKYPPPPAKK